MPSERAFVRFLVQPLILIPNIGIVMVPDELQHLLTKGSEGTGSGGTCTKSMWLHELWVDCTSIMWSKSRLSCLRTGSTMVYYEFVLSLQKCCFSADEAG